MAGACRICPSATACRSITSLRPSVPGGNSSPYIKRLWPSRYPLHSGEAPLEYLTGWRMQKATGLLQKRDKKLFEVAKSVGYDSDAAFSKALKRVFGVARREYRRNVGTNPTDELITFGLPVIRQ